MEEHWTDDFLWHVGHLLLDNLLIKLTFRSKEGLARCFAVSVRVIANVSAHAIVHDHNEIHTVL